jgi:hypothetical protein
MTVTAKTFELVWDRDQGRCVRCGTHLTGPRGVAWSVHHRRPRGMGGSREKWVNLPGNLLLLCGSGVTGCHGWVESHRETARASGFLVPLNGAKLPAELKVMHVLYGEVLLDDFGGKTSQEVPF